MSKDRKHSNDKFSQDSPLRASDKSFNDNDSDHNKPRKKQLNKTFFSSQSRGEIDSPGYSHGMDSEGESSDNDDSLSQK